nr:bifunctional hydroxymethylpyrimidine kinase/phosphomethylpyrimidine kinase [Thermaerobacter marianensis]
MTIAGSDSGGGAGIQADLKTFNALRVFGTSAITALTAQNTEGVRDVHLVPPEMVAAQIDAVLDDIGTDAAKTGMLGTTAIVEAVAERVRFWRQRLGPFPLVVDPVMIAKSGAPLLDEPARAAIREHLLPLATVVTPNRHEAEELTGLEIRSLADARRAAAALHALGPAWVVVKGGHVEEGSAEAVDVVFDGHEWHELRAPRIATRSTHGTGCTFSAAITAYLARGYPVLAALQAAKAYITDAIRHAPAIGRGHGPTSSFYPWEPGGAESEPEGEPPGGGRSVPDRGGTARAVGGERP